MSEVGRLGVVGLGLLGGSVARAARARRCGDGAAGADGPRSDRSRPAHLPEIPDSSHRPSTRCSSAWMRYLVTWAWSLVLFRCVDWMTSSTVAESASAAVTDAKAFAKPIVTTLEPLKAFYPAEAHHQDYVCRNPTQGYVRAVALPKVAKVREKSG